MKKIVILTVILINIFASEITDKYLNYTNKLVYYSFNLNNLNKIHTPCEPVMTLFLVKRKKTYIKSINLKLLSILNNRAYFLIKEYLGDQLIKEYKKWVKINDKIGDCKINKITFANVILKCKNELLIKTLNKKIPGIKETK